MNYYAPVVLGMLEQYKPSNFKGDVGIGTLISLLLPYSLIYLATLALQLAVWFFFKLPLGPGAGPLI